jgi:hypothetical protein
MRMIFRRAAEGDVFGCCAGRNQHTLPKTAVVEALAAGENARVAIGGASQGTTGRQSWKAVLSTERIEVQGEGWASGEDSR